MTNELKLYVIECESSLTDFKYKALTEEVGATLLTNGWTEVLSNKYPIMLYSETSDVKFVENHHDFANYANMGYRSSINEAKKVQENIANQREYKKAKQKDKKEETCPAHEPVRTAPTRQSQLVMGEYLKYHVKYASDIHLFENCDIIRHLMACEKFVYAEYAVLCNVHHVTPMDEQKAWWKAVVMCSPKKLQVIVAETQKPLIGDRIWEEVESDDTTAIYKGICEANTEKEAILQTEGWAREFFML